MLYGEEAKKTLRKALKALGKENLTLIVHGGSFPAEEGKDCGFGTYNSRGGARLMEFISGIFNSIQLGPAGKTRKGRPSPYAGTVFSINPLFIDLESLTTEEWGKILSAETYRRICDENPKKGTNRAAYDYAFEKYDEALREAFAKFDANAPEYKSFKTKNNAWLEKDSVYEALAKEHSDDYWENWKDETDRRLFCSDGPEKDKLKEKRLADIKKSHSGEIEFYSFCQYVAWKQGEKSRELAKGLGIKLTADRQVSFSDRDIWANQDLFMKGWYLGCPPDNFAKDGQAWGFPMIDPKRLFNEDGSLGDAGVLIKNLYVKMFTENPGGVRIDHVVGLIDPWVYKKGGKPTPKEGAGRLYSSPENPELAKYAIARMDDIRTEVREDDETRVKSLDEEQTERYAAFMQRLIVEAAEECGLGKDEIICEDLGSQTFPVETVMEKHRLNGMRLIQFSDPNNPASKYRSSNVPENCWIMAGTHDSEPISLWSERLMWTHLSYLHALNLMEDVYPYMKGKERDDTIVRLTRDSKFMALTKMTELFASKARNVQIFFADLFGIREVYNTPGDEEADNWTLRIPADFEDLYRRNRRDCGTTKEILSMDYEELNKRNTEDGYALDLATAIRNAMRARGEKFTEEHSDIMMELDKITE